jgi:hypothetical protein
MVKSYFYANISLQKNTKENDKEKKTESIYKFQSSLSATKEKRKNQMSNKRWML